MTKEQILTSMQARWNEFEKIFGYEVFGVFYFGSENYGLSDEHSDIDCRLVYFLPYSKFNQQYDISDFETPKGEHIECMDIKLFFGGLNMMDLQILESLYTDYYIINPKYADLWEKLHELHAELSHAQEEYFAKSIRQKLDVTMLRLERKESEPSVLQKCGYAGKAAHHVLRLEDTWFSYIGGASFKEASISPRRDLLISLKRGEMPVELAEPLWNESAKRIYEGLDVFKPKRENYQLTKQIYNIYQEILQRYL